MWLLTGQTFDRVEKSHFVELLPRIKILLEQFRLLNNHGSNFLGELCLVQFLRREALLQPIPGVQLTNYVMSLLSG